MLLAVSDTIWNSMIAAVVTIVLAWIGHRTKVAVEKAAAEAAKKVAEVKDDLQAKDNTLKDISGDVKHVKKQSNHQQELLLGVNMRTTRRLYELSGDPADKVVADQSQKEYDDHVKIQKSMDKQ